MTFEERVRGLEPFGFTTRQARFVATVALHGGYCLRRQYAKFAGIGYGKNVRDFLDNTVERQLAIRFTIRPDRGHLYHFHARPLYRLLGQEDNRNRRQVSASLIARKLMVLDHVLAHPNVEWLATEDDKVGLFADHLGIDRSDLPQRTFGSAEPGGDTTTRFFPHKMPIATFGIPPVPRFVVLITEPSGWNFGQFLSEHARLFQHLPEWSVSAVGLRTTMASTAIKRTFDTFINRPSAIFSVRPEELRWYFVKRRIVDAGELSSLSVADIDRFRKLRERLSVPAVESLYLAWLRDGELALTGRQVGSSHQNTVSLGHLEIDALPFDYSQFGSLPGVA
jgi:hypothetical protein